MEQDTLSIHFKFEKHSPQPTRVFQSVERIIKTITASDVLFLKGFQSEIEPELYLEDVKDGSLLVILARRLNGITSQIPEEALGGRLEEQWQSTSSFI